MTVLDLLVMTEKKATDKLYPLAVMIMRGYDCVMTNNPGHVSDRFVLVISACDHDCYLSHMTNHTHNQVMSNPLMSWSYA